MTDDTIFLGWDPGLRYRSFINRTAGVATLVSSKLTDTVTAISFENMVMTVDSNGHVCDIEVQLDTAIYNSVDIPTSAERLDKPLGTVIPARQSPSVYAANILDLNFGCRAGGRWYRLANEALYLRVTNKSELLELAVEVTDDLDGSAEGRWLDEIERSSAVNT